MNQIGFQYAASSSAHFRRHFPKSFSLRRKVPWWDQILDPGSEIVDRWNRVFLLTCAFALFLDPLYFYYPIVGGPACLRGDLSVGILVTFARTIADFLFIFHMVLKFRTAYVAPNSRVFGRGELVMDPYKIAIRYLKRDFWVDLAAALPLPQLVTWFVIPMTKNSTTAHANHTVSLIVLLQYIPRMFQIFPLQRRIVKTSGLIAKTNWAGAAYNLGFYMLASHVLGASWYLLSIQRQYECWSSVCKIEANATRSPSCRREFLDCRNLDNPERRAWQRITKVITKCDAVNDKGGFDFGMFADAFTDEVASAGFFEKFFYCLWWGLKNLSSYGQSIETSTDTGETVFCSFICLAGLILFAHLIGNMQNYLQSATARLEEWRVSQRDTEEWMRHRQLPPELQERVRRFVQYKWVATQGVDEESILRALPLDLRRQIQRHLSLALVRRVPFFAQMDDQLLDAICERLVPSLNTKDTYIVREDDPVNEMLFIVRGQLDSSTTNGGRTGFFNSITLRPGDFCGEELLTWALVPSPSASRPSSTRTVRSLTEVEGFALRADDLKFVASQFKRLHSKKLQHAFRYYSHQWRTWGACFLQAAWRRYSRRKEALKLAEQENIYYTNVLGQGGVSDDDASTGSDYASCSGADGSSTADSASHGQHFGVTVLASRFAANTRKAPALKMPKLAKPDEPDFSKFSDN